jgi:eukaryotic-like serine/threonine-protein kinase
MPLSAGTKLGPYEILAPIGAGGMGEVYKARDKRLDRIVAIKVSKEHFSERFEREAKAIAALNHPHICQIYDVGPDYLVMEYVEGSPPRGPLPPEKAVEYAAQILDALDAAHQKGIIHRDLKPANILVTKQGIKLLDFGLAKQAVHLSGDDATESVTIRGEILGTLQYMSPEQLLGKEVDARSDLFSFGCVLYELLTGKRAFERSSAAILEREPALLKVAWPLDRIVRRSLAQDRDQRFQTARDLKAALAWALEQPPAGAAPALVRRLRWFRVAWTGAAALAVAAIALLAWRNLSGSAGIAWKGILLGGPEVAMAPRISPDGHTLAFLAMERGITQVAVMKPDTGNWTILTHKRNTGNLLEVNWSPDGNRIYFDRFTEVPVGIFGVPALGGEEQLVLENARHPEPLPDGSLLVERLNAARQMQFYRLWPDTGHLQEFPVEAPNGVFGAARVFPDGRQVVMLGDLLGPGRQGAPHLYLLDLANGQIRRLPTGAADDSITAGLAVSRDGQSVLISRRVADMTEIVSLPASGRGSPRVLFAAIPAPVKNLDTGADGAIYLDEGNEPVHILRFSPLGGPAKQISIFPGQAAESGGTTVLPDGRTVVRTLRAGRSRLMVVEAGKEPLPLVATTEETSTPVTPAGPNQVAFIIGPEPHATLAIASLSNGRVTRRIPFDKGEPQSLASSPDGKTLYCAAAGTIWSMAVADGEPRKLRTGTSVGVMPGGMSLLVEIVETGKIRLVEAQLADGAEREIPLNGPFHLTGLPINPSGIRNGKLAAPLASADSWFFLPGLVDLATGRMTQIPVDFQGDFHDLGWAPDGSVVGAPHETRSTIWKIQPESR